MLMRRLVILSRLAAICLAGALGTRQEAILPTSRPPPPSQDPWYTAPAGFEAVAPGTVLRVREAPGGLAAAVANASAAYHVLYRTTDTRNRPSWAVTTLLAPASPRKDNGTALLTYLVPYDAASVDMSPSWALYDYVALEAARPVVMSIERALGAGWYVSVPDYEGPLASFLAGHQAAYATLDSARAVLSWGPLAGSGARHALWGYSGGAIAGEWAAELQGAYAPELAVDGVALGGVPARIVDVLRACSGRPCAIHFAPGIVGLTRQWPAIRAFLVAQLRPAGPHNATTFLSVQHLTLTGPQPGFAGQNMSDYFVAGADAFFADPRVRWLVDRDARLGFHGTPQMPLYAYHGVEDEVIPVATTDAWVQMLCEAGAKVQYRRIATGTHDEVYFGGWQGAFEFLEQTLTGTYRQRLGGCSVDTVS